MTIQTHHGHSFTVETQGFRSDSDRDLVEDAIYSRLASMTPAQIADLHRSLTEAADDHPALATDIAEQALIAATKDWHDPNGAAVMISAT